MQYYFDAAASAQPLAEVVEAYIAFHQTPEAGANPNATHALGRAAFATLEGARKDVAHSLGARRPSEIIFCAGGTEADNLALFGMARAMRAKDPKRSHILISAFEHHAVSHTAHALEREGFDVHAIRVTSKGLIDVEHGQELIAMFGPQLALISCMLLQNEIGTIQTEPLKILTQAAHAHGALVHTDAVQAAAHLRINLADLGIDAASFSAHKVGGLRGSGVLYLRHKTPCEVSLFGGGQEMGYRSGTQAHALAAAFAHALKLRLAHFDEQQEQTWALRERLIGGLQAVNPQVTIIGETNHKAQAAGIVALLTPGFESETLQLALSEAGFMVSGGAACSSRSLEPSDTMQALGIDRDDALSVLRISFDYRTTPQSIDALVTEYGNIIERYTAQSANY